MYEAIAPGWGSSSIPSKAAEQFGLDAHLASVPEGGLVVDVGAGVGCGMGAFIYLARPDITVVSVDPGYCGGPDEHELVEGRDTVIDYGFEDEAQREALRGTDKWYSGMQYGFAEDLPVGSASVDLLLSYAATPEYADNLEQALEECIRVLKLGGAALHGPIYGSRFELWQALLEKAKQSGEVKDHTSEQQDIDVGEKILRGVHFTALRK